MRKLLYIAALMLALCMSCTIEPPLKLASGSGTFMALGKVVTNLDTVWDIDDWEQRWWYGWDEADIAMHGELAYPEPQSFETRFYYFGEAPDATWSKQTRRTVYEKQFYHSFDYGYHDMLIWSNITSPDGTQVVIINEDDPNAIYATTSMSRVGYAPMLRVPAGIGTVRNNPEIFYANEMERLFMSRNLDDYDYYDDQLNAWVKEFHSDLYPMVYIYLVQVVIYNNRFRVTGLSELPSITSLADGVSIHTGRTSETPVAVTYMMRLKNDLPARNGRKADILGGMLHTFGLCGMDSWAKSRGHLYAGSRTDLNNLLALDFQFANGSDSVYFYDVTRQIQTQAHGGIITIEIDADTLRFPSTGGSGSGFKPTINPGDSITYEYDM